MNRELCGKRIFVLKLSLHITLIFQVQEMVPLNALFFNDPNFFFLRDVMIFIEQQSYLIMFGKPILNCLYTPKLLELNIF